MSKYSNLDKEPIESGNVVRLLVSKCNCFKLDKFEIDKGNSDI